jgi:hypothetical protein
MTCVFLLQQMLQLHTQLKKKISTNLEMLYPSKIIVLGHEEPGIPSSGSSFNLVTEVFPEQHIVDVR